MLPAVDKADPVDVAYQVDSVRGDAELNDHARLEKIARAADLGNAAAPQLLKRLVQTLGILDLRLVEKVYSSSRATDRRSSGVIARCCLTSHSSAAAKE